MPLLITGASGFLGSATLAALADSGRDVRGMVRETSDLRRIQALDHSDRGLVDRLRVGSLGDRRTLRHCLDGVDTLVHCAALASDWGSDRAFEAANVEGVEALLEAAAESGVSFVVLISTTNVAGYGPGVRDESTVAEGLAFRYSRTKLAGELRAIEVCDRAGIGLATLRPSAIYGPGDWKWSYPMCRLIERGRWPLVSAGKARMTPVFVGNVVAGIEAALHARRPGTFNLTDDIDVSWRGFAEAFADALEVPFAGPSVPFAVGYPVSIAFELAYRLVRARAAPPVTRYRMIRSARDFRYSCDRAKREIGYRPAGDLAAHAAATVAWYRAVAAGAPNGSRP